MHRRLFAALPLLVAVSAGAETPNVEPGLWEYENITRFDGDVEMPEQRDTHQECLTQEDLDRGIVFEELQEEGCEVTDNEVTRNHMRYTAVCTGPDGGDMEMDFRMELMGDRTEGVMSGNVQTPMGEMTMRVETSGRRVGDC